MEKITVGIVNYNGKGCLPDTIAAILHLKYTNIEIIVVDNNSDDGSREWFEENFPHCRCICLDRNVGPAGAKNIIIEEARTDIIFILDNDITVEPDCLSRLMNIMKRFENRVVCHPEILDAYDPMAYHYNGGWIHYLCTFVSRPDPAALKKRDEYEIFDAVSGAALLIDRNIARRIGGFDNDYFFNWEDGDFTSRMTLAGYLCVNIPHARVHHRSKPRGTSKVFYQVRNRWFFILKLYSWQTIILCFPVFLVFEISQALFLAMKGSLKEYIRGSLAVFHHLPSLMEKRRAFQKIRINPDREWLKTGDMYIPENILNNRLLKPLIHMYTRLLNSYWKMIRRLY